VLLETMSTRIFDFQAELLVRKYDAVGPETEFEPGSRGRVLRNLLRIARVRDMKQAESQALELAQVVAAETSPRIIDSRRKISAPCTVCGSGRSTLGQADTGV
jgi:hypothetical protein